MKKSVIFVTILMMFLPQLSTANVDVAVEPQHVDVSAGQSFTVKLTVDPGSYEVGAAQVSLLFEPSAVEILSVTEGDLFIHEYIIERAFYPIRIGDAPEGSVGYGILDKSRGILSRAAGLITVPYYANITTKGTFITIWMKSLNGRGSLLVLDNVIVANPQSEAVPTVIYNGRVNIDCDVNSDGPCNFADVVIIGQNYNPLSNAACPQCSLDGDADVDSFDIRLSILLWN